MLQLRPICEHCAVELAPDSVEARICSFECTFCRSCVEGLLSNVCPNCGGGFVPRPVRPSNNWKNDHFLGRYCASAERLHRPADLGSHRSLVERVYRVTPASR